MEFAIPFTFEESYLPSPRHRKLRYRDVQSTATVSIPEVTAQEAPVALRIHSRLDNSEFRWWQEKLWLPIPPDYFICGGTEPLTPADLIRHLQWREQSSFHRHQGCDERAAAIRQQMEKYLLIDGIPYHQCGEPRYVVMTFGLGHNHGGTALMVDTWYNSNIPASRYFSALQREEALAEARRIATARGDTHDLPRLGETWIEVLIPEAVRCHPEREHGDGDPFLNRLEAMMEIADSNSD